MYGEFMKTVLVTGGIGSGKSVVCSYLASKGYPVYDSDSRCKALYDSVPGLKCRVEEAIGLPFSQIRVIFKDSSKREALESVVYPELLKDFLSWKNGLNSDIVFFESAVASSKKQFEGLFSQILLITCPENERIERTVSRDGVSREEVIDRVSQQDPFIPHTLRISNNGSLKELYDKVDKILTQI